MSAVVPIPAWLTGDIVPLAWCWRVERSDGLMLGFTTHDARLTLAGEHYSPAPGIRPSAIHQAMGLEGDSVDIAGALSADTISSADLRNGRWNNAAMMLFAVNWEAPDTDPIVITRGQLGSVVQQGDRFSAELSGRDPMLDEPLIPETSSACRATLGDGRCRVALAGRVHRAVVTAVDGRNLTLDHSFADGVLSFGRLRWLSGERRGLSAVIASQKGTQLRLTTSVPVAPGTSVEVTEGCDKRAATCRTRFANIANFRGEPHLPGMDLLTRYPGG